MPFLCPRCKAEVPPSLKACPACREQVTDFLRTYSAEPLDGKYQLISLLGIGGMGEVYKAFHTHLQAERVIKTMRPHIEADKDAHDRFVREARMATRIQHANVAALYDFSALSDGTYYMVWEYIEGVNLQRFVRDRSLLTPALAVRLAVEALRGLEAIHRAGIIHRDISPENLMITRDETGEEHVKIIDLGVAKQSAAEEDGLTKTGVFVGKLKYASPEQLGVLKAGERPDARSDLYSFGLVLYEMLTGVAPFQAETPHHYLVMHTQQRPAPLKVTNPQAVVPASLESILFRALEKDRNKRFATAAEFANALDALRPSLAVDNSTVAQPLPTMPVELPTRTPSPELSRSTALRSGSGPGTDKGSTIRRSVDAATGRRRELLDQIAQSLAREEYQQADVALQTLRMHLGVRADTDPDFRKMKTELEGGAQRKSDLYSSQIEQARRAAKPREVTRLLIEQDQKLGRRFVDAGARSAHEQWVRRRSELIDRARAQVRTESFADARETLDALNEHLGEGAAVDSDFKALLESQENARADATRKLGSSIEKARRANELDETRKLLAFYDTHFGRSELEPQAVADARAWLRAQRGGMREGRDSTADREGRRRSRTPLVLMIVLLCLVAAGAAIVHWKKETIQFLLSNTSGGIHETLAAMFPPTPGPVVSLDSGPLHPAGEAAAQEGNRWTNPRGGLEYVWVPGGSFEMGCVRGDGNCGREEKPGHKVVVHGFWMSSTETTVAAFRRFAEETHQRYEKTEVAKDFDEGIVKSLPSLKPFGPLSPFGGAEVVPSSWPAGHLSWNDASAFCKWSGGRLPTEAEWEYAARERDSRSVFTWGDSRRPPSKAANLADSSMLARWKIKEDLFAEFFDRYDDGFSDYAPVASYPLNRLGLADMAGNVWEWCSDFYAPTSYRQSTSENPAGPAEGELHVLRGGGWTSAANNVRISARMRLPAGDSSFTTGCRCVIP